MMHNLKQRTIILKWKHLFKDYYLGISLVGIIAYVVQEIPYIVMPFINLANNPIMNMGRNHPVLDILQNIFGVLSMIFLILIVKKNEKAFSLKSTRERIGFILALVMLVVNFLGWILYYTGYQNGLIIVISQFAVVPLYYLFIGLWRENYLLVCSASLFFIVHTLNGCLGFLI